MNNYDANACVSAFSKFCEETERNELTSSEDCQYWVFERGYAAAMQAVAKVITLRQFNRSTELKSQLAASKSAHQ